MKFDHQKSVCRNKPVFWVRCLILSAAIAFLSSLPGLSLASETRIIGLGDSLTHGTMDATNNATNTLNAYLQKTVESLSAIAPLQFTQPLYGFRENRLRPFLTPTNLGIDGSDIFSLEGIEYYKRVGAEVSYPTDAYFCDSRMPYQFQNDYDKVLFPLNHIAGKPVSQLDAALALLNQQAAVQDGSALVFLWIGNNDSSLAALGTGGSNPSYLPLPLTAISAEISPALRTLLETAQAQGVMSFEPYTLAAIQRNLTETTDFTSQINHILERLHKENLLPQERTIIMLLTLPYYSAVGYLFDSEDMEFYLQQMNPAYRVPPTFQRVAQPGQPITNPLGGDRISFFTFASMFALLQSGYSVEDVNAILEKDGIQQDGLVMSETEQKVIMSRIDSFNLAIKAAAQSYINVYIADVGTYLNSALGGIEPVTIGGRVLSRKWSRGNAFTLDGVHPAYTGQVLIANYLLGEMNRIFQLNAPLIDLEQTLATDPYIDWDGDGWVPGPAYPPIGLTELLFMLTDPDDTDPSVRATLPANFWNRMSRILLRELIGKPGMQQLADSLNF
jgi:lysophospholipase L1-like esterase